MSPRIFDHADDHNTQAGRRCHALHGQVRLRRQGTILHRESRTLTHRSAALSWAKHREVALEDPAELARLRLSTPTLAELIRWYIDTFETISRWQRSKQAHLEFLERPVPIEMMSR